MPRPPKNRRDPLDEPDDLLAPEDVPAETDLGPEPEGTDFDEELGEPDTSVPLGPEEDEPLPSELEDEDGLISNEEPKDLDGDEDEVSLSTDFEPEEERPISEEAPYTDEDPEGPASEWDEPAEEGHLPDAEWAELEHEGQLLAPGRVVVGYKEFVSFPDEGMTDLQARCDTGQAHSLLFCKSEALEGGMVRLDLGDHVMVAKTADEDGHRVVRTRLVLGGATRRLALRVVETDDRITADSDSPIVLGRDALEGYFVVDVALRYIHKREAVVSR